MERDDVKWWHAIHREETEHHHPRYPEEEDVVASDQDTRRIELLQILRLIRPPQSGEGPERGREPGIENIRILYISIWSLFIWSEHDHLAIRSVPDRDAMAPPELARYAPIVHLIDPIEIAWRKALRFDPYLALSHRICRRFGKRSYFDEPLQ